MTLVDSSALIAILFEEPEGPGCADALGAASPRSISAVNYGETGAVLAGRLNGGHRAKAVEMLDGLLATLRNDIAPLDEKLARSAMNARLDQPAGSRMPSDNRGEASATDRVSHRLRTG